MSACRASSRAVEAVLRCA